MEKKTDNHNLGLKLAVRRRFLDLFHHGEPLRVFDACMGSGAIWGTLRREYPVKSYWGVDVKGKSGRMKVNSERVLSAGAIDANVIDIDTYGWPYDHYRPLLEHLREPATVFLTIGIVGLRAMPKTLLADMTGFKSMLPIGLCSRMTEPGLQFMFNRPHDFGMDVALCEKAHAGNAHYVGLRIIPKKP